MTLQSRHLALLLYSRGLTQRKGEINTYYIKCTSYSSASVAFHNGDFGSRFRFAFSHASHGKHHFPRESPSKEFQEKAPSVCLFMHHILVGNTMKIAEHRIRQYDFNKSIGMQIRWKQKAQKEIGQPTQKKLGR